MKQQLAEEFKGVRLFADTMSYMKNSNDQNDHCLQILFALILTIYVFCMVLYPTFNNWNGPGTWQEVQEVWDRWQTVNAAVIALLASLIAFKATTYQYHRERENNYRAAKSKLPQALSDICSYAKECARIHHGYYAAITARVDRVQVPAPALPTEAVASIVECIRYSPVEIGNYLSKILESLQVINARLAPDSPGVLHVHISVNEISHIKYIALAYKRAENLFGYARNEESFKLADESSEALNNTARAHFLIFDLDFTQRA